MDAFLFMDHRAVIGCTRLGLSGCVGRSNEGRTRSTALSCSGSILQLCKTWQAWPGAPHLCKGRCKAQLMVQGATQLNGHANRSPERRSSEKALTPAASHTRKERKVSVALMTVVRQSRYKIRTMCWWWCWCNYQNQTGKSHKQRQRNTKKSKPTHAHHGTLVSPSLAIGLPRLGSGIR